MYFSRRRWLLPLPPLPERHSMRMWSMKFIGSIYGRPCLWTETLGRATAYCGLGADDNCELFVPTKRDPSTDPRLSIVSTNGLHQARCDLLQTTHTVDGLELS